MATTSIILDTRREKKTGKYPVKLRITYLKEQRYYPFNIDLKEEDFKMVMSPRPKGDYKDYFLKFSTKEAKAAKIIENLEPFTFFEFEKQFLSEKLVQKKDVYQLMQEKANALKRQKRIGTAISFETSLNSLQAFKKKLRFEEITPEFLHAYEEWLLNQKKSKNSDQGKSRTTVGIYLRNLRTIYNYAINEKLVSRDDYPFGTGRYEIPAGNNIKKALSKDQIRLLYHYKPVTNNNEEMAKGYWFLSYFLNGVNITDLAYLRNMDIHGDFIVLQRKKTLNTRRSNPKLIRIPLLPQAKEIINRYKVLGKSEDYVFPILQKGMSAEKEKATIQQHTKIINKWMKHIAKKLEIDKPVTTYTARHSFATILKKEGTSIQVISEMLGHTNEKTTQNYLDSFEDEQVLETANRLAAFL